jgi:soluble lytic murein transglycosylase-like protein
MTMPSRSSLGLLVLLAALLGGWLALLYFDRTSQVESAEGPAPEPAAPADLAKDRPAFLAGMEALQRQDGADAIRHLSGFSFGERAVEQYRLYFLANAYEMRGQPTLARRELARLWRRNPQFIYVPDSAFTLGTLYDAVGVWNQAADAYGSLSARVQQPAAVRALARTRLIEQQFRLGDPSAMLYAARNLVIDSPQSEQAAASIALMRSLLPLAPNQPLPLTLAERIRRAENLVRDGNPAAALAELRDLNPASLRSPLQEQVVLTRGLALYRLRRFGESDRVLAPLFSGAYKFAEPALVHSARNNRIIAASIDPVTIKTVTERKRTGTRSVRQKGKVIRKPIYRTVKKTVKQVDPAKRKRKEEFERLHVERLKDLLQIPASDTSRKEALSALLATAQAKKQTAYVRELAAELANVDPLSEPALQEFWDAAWAAYLRRDFATARELLAFIAATYVNPSIERQARYWLARAMEQSGEKARAEEIFQELVNVPYDDLYALHLKRRGLKPTTPNPSQALSNETRSWEEIAEDRMPNELRLAYELTALGANREARLEIQKNANDDNRRYADAILGDLLHAEGQTILAHRYVRRAFPHIGTVKQDQVPDHFIRVYYPLKFEKEIREAARDQDLDPYLVMALVHQESAFNPEIQSRAGAMGLMQLMPPTARELGNRLYSAFTETRLRNPEVNLKLGTYYLRRLISQMGGSVELALAAYNAGPGNLSRWRRVNRRPLDEFIESMPYHETRGYVKRITLLRSSYEKLHDKLSQPEGQPVVSGR